MRIILLIEKVMKDKKKSDELNNESEIDNQKTDE